MEDGIETAHVQQKETTVTEILIYAESVQAESSTPMSMSTLFSSARTSEAPVAEVAPVVGMASPLATVFTDVGVVDVVSVVTVVVVGGGVLEVVAGAEDHVVVGTSVVVGGVH